MFSTVYDLIIIGTGCTGLAAAMYSGRLNLKTLVIGDTRGGTIILTDIVENYPGFKKLTGIELSEKLEEHAREYGIEIKDDKVIELNKNNDVFEVKTNNKRYLGKSILLATGSRFKELKVPGEKEFMNKGVHTCALCDGIFYRDKIVAVIGGSDSAAKEALLMTQWASKVYIIARGDKLKPEPINMKRVQDNKKIGIITKTNVTKIEGKDKVEKVILDNKYKGKNELKLDGVFLAIGHIPLSELAIKLGVKVNEKKEIIIDRESKTNIQGMFAAGDVVDTKFKQAITGVGEAVVAVYSAYEYIMKSEIIPT